MFAAAAVCVLTAAGTTTALWWRERPVREAEAALVRGEADRALNLIRPFLREQPRHQRALSLQARSLVRLGQPAEAIKFFEREGAADATEMHAWAQAYMMRGRWSQALSRLTYVLEREPKNADALYEITTCRVRLGLLDQALESARLLAAVPGQEGRGHVFLGAINNDLKNYREAADAYARALEHDPDAANLQVPRHDFFLEYGRTRHRTGEPHEALPLLGEAAESAPENAEVQAALGDAYWQIGKPDPAVASWQAAVRLDAGAVEAREGLANAALQSGDAQAALRWIEPLSAAPDLRASTAYLFQRAYTILRDETAVAEWQHRTAQLRDKERVIAAAQNVLSDAPQSFWARVIRAQRFAEGGNLEQAEQMLAGLVREAPQEPFVRELAEAVRTGGRIPGLERLPLRAY